MLYSLWVVRARILRSGWPALSSRQKSTPLISGRLTSSKSTCGFQKPREFRHSMALCATPATRAQPELSISPRNPSVRILWSSTRATLIGPSIPDKFQFHMRFGALFAGGDLHFPLEGRHPLADVPKAHALHRGLG